jgi:hypothetical protein
MSQGELLPIQHRSLQPQRLRRCRRDRNPERIYAAHWIKVNRRRLSNGHTLLAQILCPTERDTPPAVSRRDAVVAACVIQWLGTNCGLGFLWEAERAIEAADDRLDAARRRSLVALRQERRRARAAGVARATAVTTWNVVGWGDAVSGAIHPIRDVDDGFALAMVALAEAFGVKLTEHRIRAYYEALRDLPTTALNEAFHLAVRECRFFPMDRGTARVRGGRQHGGPRAGRVLFAAAGRHAHRRVEQPRDRGRGGSGGAGAGVRQLADVLRAGEPGGRDAASGVRGRLPGGQPAAACDAGTGAAGWLV